MVITEYGLTEFALYWIVQPRREVTLRQASCLADSAHKRVGNTDSIRNS